MCRYGGAVALAVVVGAVALATQPPTRADALRRRLEERDRIANGRLQDRQAQLRADEEERKKPFDELARNLSGKDLEKRLFAVEGIQKYHPTKLIDVLPQLLVALGEEMDTPHHTEDGQPLPWVRKDIPSTHLERQLMEAVNKAGPGRVKVAKARAADPDYRVRTAALTMWGMAAVDQDTPVDGAELLTAVRTAMKDESRMVRTAGVIALRGLATYPDPLPREAVEVLVAALKDRWPPRKGFGARDDPALMAGQMLARFGGKAKPAYGALLKVITTDDADLVGSCGPALRAIALADPSLADEVVGVIRPIVADTKRTDRLRTSAAGALVGIGPAGRLAIPELAEVIKTQKVSVGLRAVAYSALSSLGPRAAEAVPALVTRLGQSTDERELQQLLVTLRSIGPAAAPAIEALEKWIEVDRGWVLNQKAREAIVAIKK